jgi:hypothetical protein
MIGTVHIRPVSKEKGQQILMAEAWVQSRPERTHQWN